MSILRTAALLVWAVIGVPALFAQLDNAAMLGTVTDASGAVFPGAAVSIQNQGTSATVSLLTDDNGSYVAPVLPVGLYRVTVSAKGFKMAVRENIRLRVADRTRIDFTLEPGQVHRDGRRTCRSAAGRTGVEYARRCHRTAAGQ